MLKKITAIFVLGIITCAAAFADTVENGFFDAAIKNSSESKKPLLFLYTGRSWCPPCKAFEKNVINTAVWKKYADEKIVFLVCDIDDKIAGLELNGKSIKGKDLELKQQDEEIRAFCKNHKINSVPTLMVYKPESKSWKTIRRANNPEAFINILEEEWKRK